MLDYLLVLVIVAAAALYTFRKLFGTLRGKKSCCSQVDSCQLVEFANKKPGGKALKCQPEAGGLKGYRELTGGKNVNLPSETPARE